MDALGRKVPAESVRWVAPGNIHLTLKFLGETTPGQSDRVIGILARLLTDRRPFTLKAAGLGVFPTPKRPRVIWVRVEDSARQLIDLQSALEQSLAEVGFRPEGRAYHPHLTLGRTRRGLNGAAEQALSEVLSHHEIGALGEWRVEGLTLMRSDLRPDGPVYTPVRALALGVRAK
jgi:2'-5' RNA ligase